MIGATKPRRDPSMRRRAELARIHLQVQQLGLDEGAARLYAEQTMRGAATLAMSSELSLEQLRVNVCSPGGSTIEGVKIFQASELEDTVFEALKASYIRTKELAKGE